MNKLGAWCALAALGVFMAQGQEISKPLNEGELLNTLDSLGTGDPLRKQPLSIGDDKPARKEKTAAKKEKGPTEITALEATFDQKNHQAVFIGEVVVKDPEFNVQCDTLTAYLKKGAGDNPAPPAGKPRVNTASPSPGTPAPKPEMAKESKGGGLERAVAQANKGSRVLITQEKVEADGSVSRSIGKGDKVVYVASTGDITLTGMPEVEQGINTCVATDPGTIITLNREGRMRVVGPHKTVITDTSASNSR